MTSKKGTFFSIIQNPINNDYDKTVITTNFGLVENVVGGIITPYEHIINKISKKIVEKLGNKEKIIKINKDNDETSTFEQNKEKQKESYLSKKLNNSNNWEFKNIENNCEIPLIIE